MSKNKKYNKKLDKIQRDLDWIVQYLLLKDGHPPSIPPYVPDHDPTYIKQNVCTKCGITLEGVMFYACQHADCPVGLGPVTCNL